MVETNELPKNFDTVKHDAEKWIPKITSAREREEMREYIRTQGTTDSSTQWTYFEGRHSNVFMLNSSLTADVISDVDSITLPRDSIPEHEKEGAFLYTGSYCRVRDASPPSCGDDCVLYFPFQFYDRDGNTHQSKNACSDSPFLGEKRDGFLDARPFEVARLLAHDAASDTYRVALFRSQKLFGKYSFWSYGNRIDQMSKVDCLADLERLATPAQDENTNPFVEFTVVECKKDFTKKPVRSVRNLLRRHTPSAAIGEGPMLKLSYTMAVRSDQIVISKFKLNKNGTIPSRGQGPTTQRNPEYWNNIRALLEHGCPLGGKERLMKDCIVNFDKYSANYEKYS